eukprot:CAMPEP_0194287872 /NCGR_PEP_ID=MMETSP0169-20130528/35669_1 /TAXON_ID=218684 /ORGANISM="Corethron pennatum, Strain L29A3" /LENGTH=127 /DNA_ID=CAMNT_0039034711 /DNA_START=50 /DNA_END=430 /DNA_ORIENTATION=+
MATAPPLVAAAAPAAADVPLSVPNLSSSGVSGTIIPPPEIRAVVHKTALFVSKNGRAFEAKILASAQGQSGGKFAFMDPSSPFYGYYEARIRFYEEGGTDEAEAEERRRTAEAEAAATAAERARVER